MSTNTAANREVVVALSDVSKRWPARRSFLHRNKSAEREVLNNVSLELHRGSILTLLGENGAGKTTLLKIIAGLAREDSGTVTLFGKQRRSEIEVIRKRKVSYSGGERGFYYRMTVRENLTMFAKLDGFTSPEREMHIAASIAATDLEKEMDRRFGDLSSGLRQRVAIARALLGDVDLLLLDEPTRTLDPLHSSAIRSFIRDTLIRDRGKTVILATNQMEEARLFGDCISVVRNTELLPVTVMGVQCSEVSLEEIFEAPPIHD